MPGRYSSECPGRVQGLTDGAEDFGVKVLTLFGTSLTRVRDFEGLVRGLKVARGRPHVASRVRNVGLKEVGMHSKWLGRIGLMAVHSLSVSS